MAQNHKPGSLRRFGLDYETVRASNPGIVYCSITGFGSGDGRDLPGYDLLVQAMGGLMSITGTDEPTKAGVAVVDVLTGLHSAVAMLAALRHKERTGQGQHLEISLLGSLLSSLVNQSSAFVSAGVVPGLLGNAHPSIAPYEVYRTADRPMVIAVGNDGQFERLANAIGAPGLTQDPRYLSNADRVAHRAALKNDLERRLTQAGADHWQQELTAVGVPCGPINSIAQAFALADDLGLAPTVEVEGVQQVVNPVTYASTPASYRSPPPEVDADRERVLSLLRARSR